MTEFRRLYRDVRGVTAMEFALVAPVLLLFIVLLIEGGRMEWTQQALQNVASDSARCFALGTSSCNSQDAVKSYAASLARDRGISLANASVSIDGNQTCNSVPGMNKVTITLPFEAASGLLSKKPELLTASACFPSVM